MHGRAVGHLPFLQDKRSSGCATSGAINTDLHVTAAHTREAAGAICCPATGTEAQVGQSDIHVGKDWQASAHSRCEGMQCKHCALQACPQRAMEHSFLPCSR